MFPPNFVSKYQNSKMSRRRMEAIFENSKTP